MRKRSPSFHKPANPNPFQFSLNRRLKRCSCYGHERVPRFSATDWQRFLMRPLFDLRCEIASGETDDAGTQLNTIRQLIVKIQTYVHNSKGSRRECRYIFWGNIQGVASISTTFENAITFLFAELARRF